MVPITWVLLLLEAGKCSVLIDFEIFTFVEKKINEANQKRITNILYGVHAKNQSNK